jgi:hypothetical protein
MHNFLPTLLEGTVVSEVKESVGQKRKDNTLGLAAWYSLGDTCGICNSSLKRQKITQLCLG